MLLYAYGVTVVAYLAPNAYALARPCALFATFVTWCRGARWVALNVLFAGIVALALECWWAAGFPADDVAEEEQQHKGKEAGAKTKKKSTDLPIAVRAARVTPAHGMCTWRTCAAAGEGDEEDAFLSALLACGADAPPEPPAKRARTEADDSEDEDMSVVRVSLALDEPAAQRSATQCHPS